MDLLNRTQLYGAQQRPDGGYNEYYQATLPRFPFLNRERNIPVTPVKIAWQNTYGELVLPEISSEEGTTGGALTLIG